jgi:hypothetical protein
MTASELLIELRSRGAIIEANGDRLRIDAPKGTVTTELRDALSQQKSEIILLLTSSDLEVDWRVKAMLPHVPDVGPIPFLIAREISESQDKHCLSCGEPLDYSDAFRCTFCSRAANLALELSMSKHKDKSNKDT